MAKTLQNSDVSGARKNVPDIEVFGNGDMFQLLCKASSQKEGWMKSTKAMQVGTGCVVQVTTQQRNPDGSYAVAEALTYVPDVEVVPGMNNGRQLVQYESPERAQAPETAPGKEISDMGWKQYRKTALQEMRPYVPGEDMTGISVNPEDTLEEGGKVARNSKNHKDQWYVGKEFCANNYAEAAEHPSAKQADEASIESAIQAKGLESPRLRPAKINAAIRSATYTKLPSGKCVICELTLQNGFTVRGEAACVSPENFDQEIGNRIAFQNAREKVWQLEGYLLQEKNPC